MSTETPMFQNKVVELRQERADILDQLTELNNEIGNESPTKRQREKWDSLNRQADRLKLEIDRAAIYEEQRMERAQQMAAHLSGTQPGPANDSPQTRHAKSLVEGIREVRSGKPFVDVAYNPRAFFQSEKRATMTPGSGSALGMIQQSTAPTIGVQDGANLAWMEELSMVTVPTNNAKVPYIDRDNRLTAQNKAYTGTLTEQAYVVDSYDVAFKNYYTYLEIHNDVFRDGNMMAGVLQSFLMDTSRQDILLQVGNDVLTGAGSSNDLTGVTNIAGVQTQDAGGALTDYTEITKAYEALLAKNVDPRRVAMIVSPGLWKQLADLQATDNQPLQMPRQIEDLRVYVSSQLPEDQGAGSDTTAIIGDLSRLVMYAGGEYQIAASNGPSMNKDASNLLMAYRVDLRSWQPDHLLTITGITV